MSNRYENIRADQVTPGMTAYPPEHGESFINPDGQLVTKVHIKGGEVSVHLGSPLWSYLYSPGDVVRVKRTTTP